MDITLVCQTTMLLILYVSSDTNTYPTLEWALWKLQIDPLALHLPHWYVTFLIL